jgi:hypothetical protein
LPDSSVEDWAAHRLRVLHFFDLRMRLGGMEERRKVSDVMIGVEGSQRYLAHKKHPPPYDGHRSLDIKLR